ncbi:MAG: type II secretion system secretin GspD [Arenicellales bacterium]
MTRQTQPGLFNSRQGLPVVLTACLVFGLIHPLWAQSPAVENGAVVDLSFQQDLQFYASQIVNPGIDIRYAYEQEELDTDGVVVDLNPSELARVVDEIGAIESQVLLAQTDNGSTAALGSTDTSQIARAAGENGEDVITLNFQGADINALISLVSQVTEKSFIVDPRVKGKVTLVSGVGLPADKLYEIFLSVLEVSNFAAIPSGEVIKILPKNLVKQHPTPTNESPSGSDEQITHIVTLEHASAVELLPILRPLLPPTDHIAPHAGSNTLILTGTAANISRTLGMIKRMDTEQRGVDIRVLYLAHADATKMSQIIGQTLSSLNAESSRTGQPVANVSVQVDEGLNALIVQAPEAEFPVIQALIDQLDVDRPEAGDTHVVYLKYAQAADLVTLLGGLQQPATQNETGAVPLPEVSVQADEQSNALVIRADQSSFEEIKSVIEKLDIRRAQVFVETIIAEVSANKESELGVDWNANKRTSSGGDVNFNTGFSESVGGVELGYIDRFFTNLSGAVVPNLNVVLHALRGDSNTNIISTPNLLTLDNEAAEIVVGQEVPFVTGNFTSTASATNITADGDGNAVGVVNPFQTIERKNVGLTLRITPQINEGNTIRLEIEQEISSVAPTTVQGASDLITDTRSIEATVQVDDQQIIVLGGLIRDDSVDTHEWVPVLGKIPLLGLLFRKKTKKAVKTNLMVFLRPKIIRTPEDLALLTEERYEFIRNEEVEAQQETRRLLRDDPPQLKPVDWDDSDKR